MGQGPVQLSQLLCERLRSHDLTSALQNACDKLLHETGGDARPPVRLASLARHLGAELQYDDKQQIGAEEAALRLANGRIVLWVSKRKFENSRSRLRARFSIAHEIGHLILYHIIGSNFLDFTERDSETYRFTEQLCDLMASYLLMPRALLAQAVREQGFTSKGMHYIANLFDVSRAALFRAVADLFPDGAIYEWRKFKRKPAEELSWRVWASFPASSAEGQNVWLPQGCSRKHLQGLGEIENLRFDQPLGRPDLRLSRGRTTMLADGVLVRWPLTLTDGQLSLSENSSRLSPSPGFRIDCSAGRLMVLVTEKNRLNFSLLSAKDPDANLHLRRAERLS